MVRYAYALFFFKLFKIEKGVFSGLISICKLEFFEWFSITSLPYLFRMYSIVFGLLLALL